MNPQAGEISLSGVRSESVQPKTVESAVPKIDLVGVNELCGEIAQRWGELRENNSGLGSPYFDVEFTRAVGRVRSDVEIATFRNNEGQIVAIFPFQRVSDFHAEPVGGRLNDVHGVLASDDANQIELLKQIMDAAGLKSFGFHAMKETGKQPDSYGSTCFRELGSYFIDMEAGWDSYVRWSRRHTKTIKRQGQKTRAMEREIGPLRFEFDSSDAEALETLIELKRAKYQRSKTFDILSVEWAANLLRELSTVHQTEIQGLLSLMYAGDEIVGLHFGMLTQGILHYWFPVYDPKFSKYSPGTELLLQVAQQASLRGIKKVDLGYGDDAYKFKFCNGQESVFCGMVSHSEMALRIAKRQYEIRQRLKGIPLKPLAKTILRSVFPGFGQWNFK